ncbi:MAG: TVP38/TMEM64 family protein [Planctomycetota bacterium]
MQWSVSSGAKTGILVAVLVAAGILAAWFRFDQTLVVWLEALRDAGWAGVVGFVALYIAATVLSIPGSLLTLAAGLLYGPWLGTAIVSPASVTGATIAFALGRTVARDWVKARVAKYPLLSAIDAAIGRRPFFLTLLLRLSPAIPFNALNYGLGVTAVSWRHYVLGSFLGMLPGTFLYVYLGSLAGSVAEISAGAALPTTGKIAVWTVGGIVTLLSVVVVTRAARRELHRSLPEQG